jgi:prepilin-type N-terminal cleavage/methylation domain-containing protein
MNKKSILGAFSLVEVLITISVIGIVATIAYTAMGDISKSSREQKLSSDTDTLNRAVQVYLANGGSLDGVQTADQLLSKLKSSTGAADAFRLPGMSSSLIDPRLSVRWQNSEEAGKSDLRAEWDAQTCRFVVAASGTPGIKEFYFEDDLAEATFETDTRKGPMLYAKDSDWIWDYQDTAPAGPAPGPTVMAVVASPVDPPAVATVLPPPPSPPPPPPATALSVPAVFLPGGSFPIDQFDLTVSIVNPNPAGSSRLVYSVDYGVWRDYFGPILVQPDSVVSAQAIALTTDWTDSGRADAAYTAIPATLSPAIISTSSNLFGLFFNREITVTLTDPNKPGVGLMQYRINDGPWIDYTDPFVLDRLSYMAGAEIEARIVSAGSPYYIDSVTNARFLPNTPLDLTGTATGLFHDPIGENKMVTNLTPGNSDSYFEWGDLLPDGNPRFSAKSWMRYDPGQFATATPGQRFEIGSLSYFNGSILNQTGADTINLDIYLDLNVNGTPFNPYFDFTFELVNTVNAEDPNDPWPDADFVRFASASSNRTIVINDYEYEFRIEFGSSTADGFANFNEFHVLEAEMASVQVYGTFVEIGKVASTAPLSGGKMLSGQLGMTGLDPDIMGTEPTPTVYQIDSADP